MRQRIALLAAPILMALTAAAPAPGEVETVRVALTTDAGTIIAELDAQHAPVTTANFLRYAGQKRFDDTAFYRAMRLDAGAQPGGLIQAGTRGDPRRILAPIAHEPTSRTGILHKAGTLSMARYAPGTANGDFFILLSDMPSLDADPSVEGDGGAGFAAFGKVVSGMEIVRRIHDAPRSATLGQGVMKGEMLDPPVRIISVRRVAAD